MKYAIIQIGPFQYNVDEGKEYTVPNFEAEAGKPFHVREILAVGDGEKFLVGQPTLESARVELEILSQEAGEKITSRIYKAKSRYRRVRGHRKQVTKFKVTSITY